MKSYCGVRLLITLLLVVTGRFWWFTPTDLQPELVERLGKLVQGNIAFCVQQELYVGADFFEIFVSLSAWLVRMGKPRWQNHLLCPWDGLHSLADL
jgi:hypothetical protein